MDSGWDDRRGRNAELQGSDRGLLGRDGATSETEREVSLRAHLMMCTGCSNYRKQMKALRLVMQAYADGKAATVESDSGTAG